MATEVGTGRDRQDRTRGQRMADDVYDKLLSHLMTLRIEPGEKMTIDALARELGVSQTPVRDALSRLEVDGLVVRTHMAGYRVAPQLTRRQHEEMVEIRLLLEPASARLAAQNMSPQDTERLRELAETMAERTEGDEHLAYGIFGRRDAEFHDLIAAGGGNRLIRESLARLHTHIHLFRLMYDQKVTEEAIEEHTAVLEAITGRDSDGAAYAMRQHILRSAGRFRVVFD